MEGSQLPSEVLVIIFQHLDLSTLLGAKRTCRAWQHLIDSSVQLWRARVRQHCVRHPEQRALLDLPLYTGRRRSAARLQHFLRRLVRLRGNLREGRYSVRTIHCLEAELGGARVVKSEEWERNHNYRGVYDMILDDNRLVASVYDTIQVWDMATYSMTNILNPKSLDKPHAATTCFAVLRGHLVCGSQNGLLRLIDLQTGALVSTSRKGSCYVSDVCVRGDRVVSVDWHGTITVWRYREGEAGRPAALEDTTEPGQWEVPRLLAGREVERLLDFNAEFLVTTFKSHLTCYRHGRFYRSYPAHSDVFCLSIVDNWVAFGCKGDRESPVAGLMLLDSEGPPRVIYFRTRDNDPVISLSLANNILTLGDVNGELHRVDLSSVQLPEQGEVTVCLEGDAALDAGECRGPGALLERGLRFLGTLRTHCYRDFVWAVKADCYRTFSGDEVGKIVIHDFLMLDE